MRLASKAPVRAAAAVIAVGAAVVEAAVVGAAATGGGNNLSLKTKTAGEGARISIVRGRGAQVARSIASFGGAAMTISYALRSYLKKT